MTSKYGVLPISLSLYSLLLILSTNSIISNNNVNGNVSFGTTFGFTLVMAVDRSKFRTCTQTSFCRRHRHGRSKPAYKYQLDPSTIQFHDTSGMGVKADTNVDANAANTSGVNVDAVNADGVAVGIDVDVNVSKERKLENDEQQKEEPPAEPSASPTSTSYIQKFKKMLTGESKKNNDNSENDGKIDPYVLGPEPFFTAKLMNDAPITSTGSTEKLNLAIHLHDDGVARIRITEEYGQEDGQDKPFSKARWSSDELILNHEEMKSATNVYTFDHSTEKGKELLDQLKSTLEQGQFQGQEEEDGNYIGFRYGNSNNNVNVDAKKREDAECFDSSLFLIQFQPFALHLWREKCNDNDKNYGPPAVSVNTNNLLHFEIRRLQDGKSKNDLNEAEQHHTVIDNDDDGDRHGGKKITGYWEDGLAIYEDGSREERREDTNNANAEKRRVLMDQSEEEFHFDTDGMWEESFGSHVDSKPYGPMSVGADITFPASTHLFGLPEHASGTQLKGTTGNKAHYKEPYRLYNLDVFEYELDETMALYGEVPLIVSQSKTSGTVGAFWFNPTETFVDVENLSDDTSTHTEESKTHWISESGVIDLFLLPGPDPKTLYQQYATLTGRMPLPPMWSLGYHQCRWNYRDEADVYQVHGKFEELDYPYDVLWLDIEHTDGKRYFTWDKNLFPNPIPMQEKLSSQGRKMVTIVDPHIKRDDNYYIHKKATEKGLYIKDKTGKKDYDGWCWPGSSSYLDFTNEHVRNWWAKQFAYDHYIGSTPSLFTWNDMNEPSVFNGPEVSMQKDLRNLDGVEHREWHNLYGILFQRATAEGLTRRNTDENVRPFVLSRSFFAGSQRYGSIWTGDNESTWGHLKIAAPMLLGLNTAALSFVGADVGGFFGNPDAELMTRWMQAGAYQPFFRGHAHHDAKRREPWIFGHEWMVRMRHAAMARYALLPYWYTVFREAGITGMPVMRTMWMQYPEVEGLYGIDDQYLIGSDLLVKPVTEPSVTETEIRFPLKHDWYDVDTMMRMPLSNKNDAFETVTVSSDIDKIPVYQRGGSIIARKPRLRRSTQMMINDPYTLYIALDQSSNKASGVLYMDDENSFDHEKKGYFGEAQINVDMNKFIGNKVSTHSSWISEEMIESRMVERIIIMGVQEAPAAMYLDSVQLTFSYDEESKVMVVRKPNVSALSEWEITFSQQTK